jgi:predicted ATP-dependent protease
MACVLALVACVTGCRVRPMAVTAAMQLNGTVLEVGGVTLKSHGVKAAGVRALMVPECNRGEGASDGATLIGVQDAVQVIRHMCIKHPGRGTGNLCYLMSWPACGRAWA